MRRWWLVIALLLSLGLNLGIFAALVARRAGPPDRDRPRPEERAGMGNPGANPLPRLPRLADRLGLEGEKRRRFLDLQWKLFEESSRLRLQLGEVHREIKREMIRDEPDGQQIERLLQESARVYLNLERSLTRNILSTRELLDDREERQYLALIGRIGIPLSPGDGPEAGGPRERRGPGPEGEGPGPDDRPRLDNRFEQREQQLQQREERLRLREERMREIQERFRNGQGRPGRMMQPPPYGGRRRPPGPGRERFPIEEQGPPPPPEEEPPPGTAGVPPAF
ncbi:MAG TPA: periplasmic heavy metal sensor [Thermoanaerobaculia bacterium]